ncbi:MAG TPA: S41 family peptidase [Opitutaceae bacterium]|jgi:carboxyl-terminal processing protease|nr:S41 family peptidase [Opitutaceae bacterium]
MRKRIFAGAVLALGLAVPAFAFHFAALFGLVKGDVDRAVAYVRDVMVIVNEKYVDPKAVNFADLARNALHGMVESLDPHSEFLEKKDNDDLAEDLSGEFGGVGIQVEVRSGKVQVIEPMDDTPAARAGIERGDEIESIDGRSVAGSGAMDAVVDRLRGKPHTHVAMTLYRPKAHKSYSVDLEREIIKVDSVIDTRVIDDDVGYVLVTEFSEHTGEQFAAALDKLLKQNINSLIIDLRNNPGGTLDSAVEVAEPFFRKGDLIVSTRGRRAEDNEEFRSEADGDPLDLPVAVLINQDTASAAEIVTGALKDTGKAVVVGERSFGKGSVQTIIDFKTGDGLRLTTAKYYTPSGVSLHQVGVAPSVEVVLSAADDDKIRQQQLRPDISDPADFKARFGFTPIDDRQLDAAVAVLRGVEVLESQAAASSRVAGGRPSAVSCSFQPRAARVEISGLPPHDRG